MLPQRLKRWPNILDLIMCVPCAHLPGLVSGCHHCQILGDTCAPHVGDGFVPEVMDSSILDLSQLASCSPCSFNAFNWASVLMAEDPREDSPLLFSFFPEFLEDFEEGIIDVDDFGGLFVRFKGIMEEYGSIFKINVPPLETKDSA